MNWLRELATRLSMLVHRRQFDADLEEEMRLHLELRRQEQRWPLRSTASIGGFFRVAANRNS